MPELTQRERLILRVLELPADRLQLVEMYLQALQCGNALPHSKAAEPPTLVVPAGERHGQKDQESESGNALPHSKDWPHAPLHRLCENGTYIVSAGTLHKEHFFRGPARLDDLESKLLSLAKEHGWQLEAWAVFSNHYHFVAHALPGCEELKVLLTRLHGETSTEMNRLDNALGRQVWFNFWDTQLTFEKSYLARLNYVHQNAVKHGLVKVANVFPWCSAAWFERTATPAQVHTIYSFKTEKVNVVDDYEPWYDFGVR